MCIKDYIDSVIEIIEAWTKSYETYNISDLPKSYDYDLVIVIIGADFFTKPFYPTTRRILDCNWLA